MKLLNYLNLLNSDQRREFARALGISLVRLSQYAHGRSRISASLAIEIERLTEGLLRCEDLHPQADWGYVRSSGQRSMTQPKRRSARA